MPDLSKEPHPWAENPALRALGTMLDASDKETAQGSGYMSKARALLAEIREYDRMFPSDSDGIAAALICNAFYDVHLGGIQECQRAVSFAFDRAGVPRVEGDQRGGGEVMLHYLTLPGIFWRDHHDRCADHDGVRFIVRDDGGRRVIVQLDDAALADLLNDADHYSDPNGPATEVGYRSLRLSAKATWQAVHRQVSVAKVKAATAAWKG